MRERWFSQDRNLTFTSEDCLNLSIWFSFRLWHEDEHENCSGHHERGKEVECWTCQKIFTVKYNSHDKSPQNLTGTERLGHQAECECNDEDKRPVEHDSDSGCDTFHVWCKQFAHHHPWNRAESTCDIESANICIRKIPILYTCEHNKWIYPSEKQTMNSTTLPNGRMDRFATSAPPSFIWKKTPSVTRHNPMITLDWSRRRRRPAFSTSRADATVMTTCTTPTIIVQIAGSSVLPAASKMSWAKNMTALMPENCWNNMSASEMMRAMRFDRTLNKSLSLASPGKASRSDWMFDSATCVLHWRPQNHFNAAPASWRFPWTDDKWWEYSSEQKIVYTTLNTRLKSIDCKYLLVWRDKSGCRVWRTRWEWAGSERANTTNSGESSSSRRPPHTRRGCRRWGKVGKMHPKLHAAMSRQSRK